MQQVIDFNAARFARDAAIDRASKATSDSLKRELADAVLAVAQTMPGGFVVADVQRAYPDLFALMPEPRVLGAVMMSLANADAIRATPEHRASGQRENHNRLQRVWVKA